MMSSILGLALTLWLGLGCNKAVSAAQDQQRAPAISPNLLWYTHPADKWENAFPVGNGRLGAMVFGRTDEETIQINEDTCWSGGPYSTVVEESHKELAEIQRLVFDGQYRQAHTLFGRHLMGYPVEQQKYQALASLVVRFPSTGAVTQYRHQLDLDSAVITTQFVQDGNHYTREVFSSPVDQVIVVRLTADRPGNISFSAQLRGFRNSAHSNYATDYFQMDGFGSDGLIVRGKSADYMGIDFRLVDLAQSMKLWGPRVAWTRRSGAAAWPRRSGAVPWPRRGRSQ